MRVDTKVIDRLEASVEKLRKHLQGRHNQLTHGRGGGRSRSSGPGEIALSPDERAALDGTGSSGRNGKYVRERQKELLSEEVLEQGRKASKSSEINEYRNYGANAANGYLISGKLTRTDFKPDGTKYTKKSVEKLIDRLDEQLSDAPPIPEGIVLYSGLGARGGRALSKVDVGDEFEVPGYLSTSLDPSVAHEFSHAYESGGKDHSAVVRVKTDGKMRGHYLGFGRLKGEEEVLLSRGSKFRVTDVQTMRSKVWLKEGRSKSTADKLKPDEDPWNHKYKVDYKVITVEPVS